MREREMHCARCQAQMRFEIPPCEDGHDDCPELVCSGCGLAVVTVPIMMRVWLRPKGARVAPHQRRAA